MIATRPARRTYRGRRGANEMLTLTTWTTKAGVGYVRVRGAYDVYCGMGNMHRMTLDVRDFADKFTDQDSDDVTDTLVSEWLAWDYTGCDCDSEGGE